MKELQNKRGSEETSSREPEKCMTAEKEVKRGRWEEDSDSEEERKRRKAKNSSLTLHV